MSQDQDRSAKGSAGAEPEAEQTVRISDTALNDQQPADTQSSAVSPDTDAQGTEPLKSSTSKSSDVASAEAKPSDNAQQPDQAKKSDETAQGEAGNKAESQQDADAAPATADAASDAQAEDSSAGSNSAGNNADANADADVESTQTIERVVADPVHDKPVDYGKTEQIAWPASASAHAPGSNAALENGHTAEIPAVPPFSGQQNAGNQYAGNQGSGTQTFSAAQSAAQTGGTPPGGLPPQQGFAPPQPGNRPQSGSADAKQGESNQKAKRAALIAGVVVAVLAVLYVTDLIVTSGNVPRGTTVGDVEIGGMTPAAAEVTLKRTLGPTLHQPIRVQAGDATSQISPDQAGLRLDWQATIARAGEQPLNPFTRVSSLFTTREIPPVSSGDRTQLRAALAEVKPMLDRAPREGAIVFEGTRPVSTAPASGRNVDVDAATEVVLQRWAARVPVQVPFAEQPVSTTSEGVQQALTQIAQPAVSGPVIVHGEAGRQAVLSPQAIAGALSFEPDGDGGLAPKVDGPKLVGAAEPQLRDTLRPAIDATVVLEGGRPVVKPSADGHGVDWNKSFEPLVKVLGQRPPADRSVRAVYQVQPPRFNTDQANKLGIKEVVSEFQTGGFEPASGVNIRRVAEQVNGAVIKPGEVFSLNGHTGPRGVAQGYVESGIIEDGRPQKAVGGGISQFATTIYNASYFAGMQDVEHKPHSYYIKRYPAGREATVFQTESGKSIIDVKFKNTSPHGVLVSTEWTPSSIKVKFWSTKNVDVHSATGPRTNHTQPQVVVVPPGEPCSPSTGEPGFTVTDTRTVRDLQSGNNRSEVKKVMYEPHPIINCGPQPPGR